MIQRTEMPLAILDDVSMFEVQSLEAKLPRYWTDGTTSVGSLSARKRMVVGGLASASGRTARSLVFLQLMVDSFFTTCTHAHTHTYTHTHTHH